MTNKYWIIPNAVLAIIFLCISFCSIDNDKWDKATFFLVLGLACYYDCIRIIKQNKL